MAENKDNHLLFKQIQLFLQASGVANYTGSMDGKYDPSMNSALERVENHIKSVSKDYAEPPVRVSENGSVSGDLKKLVETLLKTKRNPLYEVFKNAPGWNEEIKDDETLKKAISQTRDLLVSSLPQNKDVGMAFDKAVANKDVKDLQNAITLLRRLLQEKKKISKAASLILSLSK